MSAHNKSATRRSNEMVDDISTGGVVTRRVNSSWDDMINQALEFKKKYGHLKVPSRCNENPKLGRWVGKWRRKYQDYKTTNRQKGDPERMKHLEKIGLVGDISTGYVTRYFVSSWDDMFNLLVKFKEKHGHLNVPCDSNENQKLRIWVTKWKSNYREYKITNGQKGNPERMKHLESVGLVGDISTGYEQRLRNSSSWNDMINQVLEFKQKHGHVKVPSRFNENPKLGRWVKNKRYKYREYKISNGRKGDPGRMKHLESIGLVDDIVKKYEEKKTNCADNEVVAPIIVSSMPPTILSNTQNINEEMHLSMIREKKKKNSDCDDGVNTQTHLDFLGSELRGGFWA